ncbi:MULTISPECIES: adenosylcobinamide-GDP ribazoletransferase [unclassified Modestobacter]|uniref:adenosylcobinamide-GDP ribazoletransferase n=1 Tax=unclassified Modestobacter TaxID=2643866 RepID=UPI0022AA1A50|nr:MULTISPECIES: adenosylcobinamide-GDP ribazoletransferase [unclassified Modestobacter]MCZ2825374.1 adenosylcobinamide-GDP ribazoletransferase [Modestobacter sp. VKM Ac-2981]MCZ2853561.1 adenosylcobinamide-GDP ribazoletransferase [Modestobacter sp. VKM Ac-2982]
MSSPDQPATRRPWTGPAESFALLTCLRVPAATSARGVLPWAPLVGLVLGGVATTVAWAGGRAVDPLVGAVLGVAVLAALTRGLHLDGLADTADGLGPLRGREKALAVMRAGDVGPFGVVTLVLTLLLQVGCLAHLLTLDGGWLALPAATVAARVAMARTGLPGVPIAQGSSLGQAVAGTVSRGWLAGAALVTAVIAAGGALLVGRDGPVAALGLVAAVAAGLGSSEALFSRARTRLGGVNGDVMGAMGEVTAAVTLLAAAVLIS